MPTEEQKRRLLAAIRKDSPHTVLIEGEPTAQYSTVYESYAKPGEGVCDFCSGAGPFHVFKAKPFTVVNATAPFDYGSADELWAGCSPCAVLLDAGDKDGLLDRSTDAYADRHHIPDKMKPFLRREIWRLHSKFWENRIYE